MSIQNSSPASSCVAATCSAFSCDQQPPNAYSLQPHSCETQRVLSSQQHNTRKISYLRSLDILRYVFAFIQVLQEVGIPEDRNSTLVSIKLCAGVDWTSNARFAMTHSSVFLRDSRKSSMLSVRPVCTRIICLRLKKDYRSSKAGMVLMHSLLKRSTLWTWKFESLACRNKGTACNHVVCMNIVHRRDNSQAFQCPRRCQQWLATYLSGQHQKWDVEQPKIPGMLITLTHLMV